MSETVLDSSCGTGGFLVNAMNHVIKQLQAEMEKKIGKPRNGWSDMEKKLLNDRISEIASSNFYGFDINPDLVKATKMNMVMNNDGSGNILRMNSLVPPHEWPADVKAKITEALGIEKGSFRSKKYIGVFDIIITNPPFGSKLPVNDPHILEQFDLGHIWEQTNNGTTHWRKTDRLQSSVPPERLFVERCHQLLKPGGRIAIVLPDSILGNPGLGYIRQWLIEHTYIIASIDLHVDTFQPRNGTQTSILITHKKTEKEKSKEDKSGQMADYNIFMAMVERVGHDKRGNPIFKRDKQGNEILVPENKDTILVDHIADGTRTSQTMSKTKVLDDQTEQVPAVFDNWKKREGIAW
jgi:type I restriction enzyme M protein